MTVFEETDRIQYVRKIIYTHFPKELTVLEIGAIALIFFKAYSETGNVDETMAEIANKLLVTNKLFSNMHIVSEKDFN